MSKDIKFGNLTLHDDEKLGLVFIRYKDGYADSEISIPKWNLPDIILWLQQINNKYWKDRLKEGS